MQESPIDTISQQADDVPDQATVADQSALKVIDRLTEKLYLERRKRWKLD